jgi:ribosome modulation factor
MKKTWIFYARAKKAEKESAAMRDRAEHAEADAICLRYETVEQFRQIAELTARLATSEALAGKYRDECVQHRTAEQAWLKGLKEAYQQSQKVTAEVAARLSMEFTVRDMFIERLIEAGSKGKPWEWSDLLDEWQIRKANTK